MGFLNIKNYEVGDFNEDLFAILMITTGPLVCFFGAKLFKYLVSVVGFLMGGYGSYFLFHKYQHDMHLADDGVLYISLTFALLAAITMFCLYNTGIFAIGALGGVLLGQFICQFTHVEFILHIILITACGLAGGFVSFKLIEWVLKPVTAFVGAFMIASASDYLFNRIDKHAETFVSIIQYFGSPTAVKTCSNGECIIVLAVWALLTICGLYYQVTRHPIYAKPEDGRQSRLNSRSSRSSGFLLLQNV